MKLPKLSELKVPGFVEDVYYDLRERHLLPLAILLVVAILAAPFLLGGGGSEQPAETPETAVAGAAATETTTESGALVARSAPGLRDYRERLRQLRAKDPFTPQFAGEASSSGSGGATESGGSADPGTGSVSEYVAPEAPLATESFEEDTFTEESTTEYRTEKTYYSYAIDVRVTQGGSQSAPEGGNAAKPEPVVRRNLPELSMLPSRRTPAVIYMGPSADGKKALLLVSSDVQSIFGDARCVLGSQRCELLLVEPGLPITFVYGGANRTFKLELLKIRLIESKKLNKAPLGEPKGKGSKQGKGD